MQHEFLYPLTAKVAGTEVMVCEIDVRVTIEADEMTGCTDWYIKAIEVHGQADRDPFDWHSLSTEDELFSRIEGFAYKFCESPLDMLWEAYIADLPASYRGDPNDEHRTLRADAL